MPEEGEGGFFGGGKGGVVAGKRPLEGFDVYLEEKKILRVGKMNLSLVLSHFLKEHEREGIREGKERNHLAEKNKKNVFRGEDGCGGEIGENRGNFFKC